MEKAFYQSKTFWFNLLTIIVAGAGYAGYSPNPELAKQTGDFLMVISPIINFALRFFSKHELNLGAFKRG